MKLNLLNGLNLSLSYLGINLLMISPSLAVSLGFETGDFTDWLTSGNSSIQNITYGVASSEGNFHALLETGSGSTEVFSPFAPSLESGNPPLATGFFFNSDQISASGLTQGLFYTQGSAIKIQNPIFLPSDKQLTLLFDYNFLTNEDVSTGNDDLAFITLNDQLIPLTSVKTANLSAPSGTPFSASTGYQFNQFYSLTTPGNYTLGFGVLDANDFATASGLLLDNIRFEIRDIPVSTAEPNLSPWLWLCIYALATRKLTLQPIKSIFR